MSETYGSADDIQFSEGLRRAAFFSEMFGEARPLIDAITASDPQQRVQVEAAIKLLIMKSYDTGEEHATTLPDDIAMKEGEI